MAESNFIDYVKILCRSGKGGCIVPSMSPRAALTAAMAVVVATST